MKNCLLESLNFFAKKRLNPSSNFVQSTQLTFTCSNSAIETLKKRCGICSKLTIKTLERSQRLFSSVSIVNFEQVNVSCLVALLMYSTQ